MSNFKGLGYKLTEDETKVLLAFSDSNEIAFPVGCNLTYEGTTTVLIALTKKDIIKGRGPYQLTKLGIKLRDHVKNNSI